jgi:hypothetical protein
MERALRLIAGAAVLLSLAAGWWLSPWFFLFTAFVGMNLFQSASTNWCRVLLVLERAGVGAPAPKETAPGVL